MAHREGITTTPSDWTMVKASTLVKDQEVITIEGSLPVEEACNVLINNNISSAPVYDAQVKEASETSIVHARSYVGMFDYGDVIAYILLVLQNMPPPGDEEEELDVQARENLTFEIKDIVRRALEGEEVPVKLASDLSQKNPFYSIMPEATLLSAVEEFAYGTHRVCVLNPDGSIKGILSQSTVAKYIFDNQRHFPDIECMMNKTLRQLGLGVSDVIAVNADSPVLDALALMSKHGISSVAVLGHMGVVLGNISMTDVKHVMKSYRHQLLWKTCFQFVSLVRTQQGIDDGQDRLPVFDVRLDTTLGFAVAKLLATKSHRVWVIDERERAIGVVSITDVMRAFASSAGVEIKPQSRQA
ncbi:uroporphyrin-III C-methyltransferase [Mucor velutinosus]|uniref:Uroporphyrin-III C-methyltransferase n=1 Tax=Mucor velutinosus TaxID=708070 RepID=A0AAN7D3W0_9FUNG|nr:uroporphyrin-III C-methyltransferase [Mucor velutinosus]